MRWRKESSKPQKIKLLTNTAADSKIREIMDLLVGIDHLVVSLVSKILIMDLIVLI
jgi:hypothetical protein